MSLNKQIHIYSVDTSAFYHESEIKIHNKLTKGYNLKSRIKKRRNKIYKKYKKDNEKFKGEKIYIDNLYTRVNKLLSKTKNDLFVEFSKNKNKIRQLNDSYLIDKNVVSVFDSVLTRTVGMKINELSKDMIIVQTYFFEVLKDIIFNGFIDSSGEKYVVYTASAGQIRTKKTVFVKENILKEYELQLTCGLTDEVINQRGTININKYLAYRALQNSATDEWINFDIDKTIVVKDFETEVEAEVDFIDDETYKIERKTTSIPIIHTDGCGIMLPSFCNKTRMVRLPWVKGLLVPFDYKSWVLEHDKNKTKIIDIYGKEYDIIKDDIQVIFTESQFKMVKFYRDWNEYKINFKKYNCQIGYCNEEPDYIKNARINYQMLQTLTYITDSELRKLSKVTNDDIAKITNDKNTMLKLLGVRKENTNKNYYQKALQYYPQLLNDTYSKEILKQVKKSMVKRAKAAKLSIDAKYTFIIPDLYAFCEWLFLGVKNPTGLLKKDEISCNLYKDNEELDCLRSPHLYLEHCVRKNMIKEKHKKWFISKGLYTSCHDVISKILQFDVDGDNSLVCREKNLVQISKRNIKKFDIVPLFYSMKKAGSMKIDKETIYHGLISAYKGGNIGMISNDITKIWNSEEINLDIIKLLCMENNFTIDYAKTLYKPTRPKGIKEKITKYTKNKVPHFFIYAKDKKVEEVESINNSVVNRLDRIIKNPNLNFKSIGGRFNYKNLMSNQRLEIKPEDYVIIDTYNNLDLKANQMINRSEDDYKSTNLSYVYQKIKKEILEKTNKDEIFVTDVLIRYLYGEEKLNKKVTLWECFGDVIINNLKNNLTKNFKYEAIECEECGKLIEKVNGRIKYCDDCWKEKQKEWDREYQRKKYNSRVLENNV